MGLGWLTWPLSISKLRLVLVEVRFEVMLVKIGIGCGLASMLDCEVVCSLFGIGLVNLASVSMEFEANFISNQV